MGHPARELGPCQPPGCCSVLGARSAVLFPPALRFSAGRLGVQHCSGHFGPSPPGLLCRASLRRQGRGGGQRPARQHPHCLSPLLSQRVADRIHSPARPRQEPHADRRARDHPAEPQQVPGSVTPRPCPCPGATGLGLRLCPPLLSSSSQCLTGKYVSLRCTSKGAGWQGMRARPSTCWGALCSFPCTGLGKQGVFQQTFWVIEYQECCIPVVATGPYEPWSTAGGWWGCCVRPPLQACLLPEPFSQPCSPLQPAGRGFLAELLEERKPP